MIKSEFEVDDFVCDGEDDELSICDFDYDHYDDDDVSVHFWMRMCTCDSDDDYVVL